jgi:hypothetical protein
LQVLCYEEGDTLVGADAGNGASFDAKSAIGLKEAQLALVNRVQLLLKAELLRLLGRAAATTNRH